MAAALALPRGYSLGTWLRVALRIAAMVTLLLACIPLFYVYRMFGQANPMPRVFLGGVAAIAGVEVKAAGIKPSGPVFLIANHVSWIDIPAISFITGSAFVGHDGLASMPLLKWLCKLNDTVFVARHDRASVAEQVEQVRTALGATRALAIFPEGTTSDGTGLLPFKSSLLSAFEPLPEGIAVQPVLLDYGPDAAQIAWVGEEHGLDNFLRLLARGRALRLTVRFLPVLAGDQLASRKAIAQCARDELLRALTR